jgi:hypothetical protein
MVGAVVAAGAVAAAIGSIIALWPKPVQELNAVITKVSIDRGVTLSEYRLRRQIASASVAHPTAAGARHLAADVSVRQNTTTTAPTTTAPTTTAPTTTAPTTTAPTTTVHEIPTLQLPEDARARVQEGVQQALNNPTVIAAPMEIGPACERDLTDVKCGLGSTVVYANVVNPDGSSTEVSPVQIGTRLAKLLAGTRTHEIAQGKVEPMGVTVNYNVSLKGFRGRKVDVRWSLYDANGGHKVPRDWLRDQDIRWWKGEAEKDSASDSFWVPLPKISGPFFIRVGVYDEDGVRLDFKDTPSFQ